jgi:hypothetical protein
MNIYITDVKSFITFCPGVYFYEMLVFVYKLLRFTCVDNYGGHSKTVQLTEKVSMIKPLWYSFNLFDHFEKTAKVMFETEH